MPIESITQILLVTIIFLGIIFLIRKLIRHRKLKKRMKEKNYILEWL